MRRRKILALLVAIVLLGFALYQNRSGYRLWPNLAALLGVLGVAYVYRTSDGSGGGR